MSRSRPRLTHTSRLPVHMKRVSWAVLLCLGGCNAFFHPGGSKDPDAQVKQTLEEWREVKPSIERLTKLEGDLDFMLNEISKMSVIGQVPGQAYTGASGTVTPGIITAETVSIEANGQAQPQAQALAQPQSQQQLQNQPANSSVTTFYADPGFISGAGIPTNFNAQCAGLSNQYQKSLAFFSFPRQTAESSKLGALHQVEQHLPMLLSANLRNRHHLSAALEFGQSFVTNGNELDASAQIQHLGRNTNSQYLVSGVVDDMSLVNPKSVTNPGLYTRFVNSAHDVTGTKSTFDKRSRQFSFTVNVRDAITGQLVFAKQYKTFGKWNLPANSTTGFASPTFWQSDYGQQVQFLVGLASDELAGVLQCQPFMARVDTQAGKDKLVIHSGTNNGLKTGDSLELYQLIYEPVVGQYQRYAARTVKRRSKVYLTEVYPSHSVGHVVDEPLLSGQYIVKAL
jgi:hypothetical protein